MLRPEHQIRTQSRSIIQSSHAFRDSVAHHHSISLREMWQIQLAATDVDRNGVCRSQIYTWLPLALMIACRGISLWRARKGTAGAADRAYELCGIRSTNRRSYRAREVNAVNDLWVYHCLSWRSTQ
jgi:hypothetical protein